MAAAEAAGNISGIRGLPGLGVAAQNAAKFGKSSEAFSPEDLRNLKR
jgi:hypothetical protein